MHGCWQTALVVSVERTGGGLRSQAARALPAGAQARWRMPNVCAGSAERGRVRGVFAARPWKGAGGEHKIPAFRIVKLVLAWTALQAQVRQSAVGANARW